MQQIDPTEVNGVKITVTQLSLGRAIAHFSTIANACKPDDQECHESSFKAKKRVLDVRTEFLCNYGETWEATGGTWTEGPSEYIFDLYLRPINFPWKEATKQDQEQA